MTTGVSHLSMWLGTAAGERSPRAADAPQRQRAVAVSDYESTRSGSTLAVRLLHSAYLNLKVVVDLRTLLCYINIKLSEHDSGILGDHLHSKTV